LHQKLPPAFRVLGQSFHQAAGMLAQAASLKNPDVVSFYYYKLVDGCVSCHARFATRRFPGFSTNNAAGLHEH